MADKAIINQTESLLREIENKLWEFFSKQTLPKLIWTMEMYNRFAFKIGTNIHNYPPDFYYHINNGMTGILHYFYSSQKKNIIYRSDEKISAKNREECYDTLYDFAKTQECREYYLISDIKLEGKKIVIKPFTSNLLEIKDFYRDQDYYFETCLNDKNVGVFSQLFLSEEKIFSALKDFYELVIHDSGIKIDAEFDEVPYSAYVMGVFYLITQSYQQSSYIIDKDFYCEHLKILDIRKLKDDLLSYINKYQKYFNADAKEITKLDIEKIYNVLSVKFDNYEIALTKGHIDRLFIQLNAKFCTIITKYSPTEYLTAFAYLNRLLKEYYPKDYDRNRDYREDIMFSKLSNCLGKEGLQLKQGIRIRDDGKTLTDIDAVVYSAKDNTAYFVQFKYQDDFIRDVRAKRNQVQHLEGQIDKWFEAIKFWRSSHTIDSFLRDSHFKNVKDNPKLKYIVFTQYNINQLLVKELQKDAIYVSDSLFYGTYSQTRSLKKLFNLMYKQNREPIKEVEHNNESYHIFDYEIYYDYNSIYTMEIENRWYRSQNKQAIDVTDLFDSKYYNYRNILE